MRRHAIIATAALLVVGCASPAPTNSPDLTACAAGADEVAASDRFWEAYSSVAPTAFDYDSLAEITADSHLIILGRVVGTRDAEGLPVEDPGGELGTRSATFGVVAIHEAIKGVPNILEPGAVLVARLGSKDLQATEYPRGEVVLFLKNYGRLREEFGKGLFGDATDRFYYGRPNGYQAVLRNLGCVVRVVHSSDEFAGALDPFPGSLEGESFEDMVETIRQMVAAP